MVTTSWVDPAKFDFYAMDGYRQLAEDKMAGHLAEEVLRASTDFDGAERAPIRNTEARITLGVIAARQADIEQSGPLWRTGIDRVTPVSAQPGHGQPRPGRSPQTALPG